LFITGKNKAPLARLERAACGLGMGLRQEIRQGTMKVKHQKELRMFKFLEIDGGFLIDLKKKGTCHNGEFWGRGGQGD